MIEEENMDQLIDWFERKAEEIRKDTDQSIDSTIERAQAQLDNAIQSFRKQAEALDILLPLNLIEMLTTGGSINSVETQVSDGWQFHAVVGNKRLFYDDITHGYHELKKGRYRFTFIVEKLSEEEK